MGKGIKKVFLAIGMKGMEEFLKKQLANDYKFVGEAIYREAIISNALQTNPDIIILRETLSGSKSILDIVYEVRLQLPDTRVIFLASDRKPGDSLLAELVGNGVYDIMTGNRLSVPDLINIIQEPNKFSDVAMYRPKTSINAQTRETIFEAPPVKEVVTQVKQTVFVEGEEPPILPPSYGQGTAKGESNTPKGEDSPKKVERKPKRNRRRFLKDKPEPVPSQEKKDIEEIELPPVEEEIELPPIELDVPKIEKQPRRIPKPQPIERVEPVKPEPTPIPQPPTYSPQNQTFNSLNSKQKILTFVGGDHGVGNSQVAFNTAMSLGKRGFKTIFIELKEEGSTIEYLYQLALADKGLDYALNNLSQENFEGLASSIINIEEVQSQNRSPILAEAYKKFPSSVDYLFFSPDYVLERDLSKKKVEPAQLKELCMHLFFQLGYHYIVLDTEPNLFNPFSEVALGFGTHVFYTLTQDVCHIGRAVRNISEVNKRINIVDKLYYIVNKFDDKADLSVKDIQEWLKADIELTIPELHKDFVNANMNGQPVSFYSKNKSIEKSFEKVANYILKI